jgi:hypothetical protein
MEPTELPTIESCSLDQSGRREQGARYARLASGVSELQRHADALVIEFREDFERPTLDQTLAVERECCPFFRFEFDESHRRLRITVADAHQRHALDALTYAFGAARAS